MRTSKVNGIPMRWHEQGEGMPVILIHGIPTSPLLWRHVIARTSGARVLAWEMVGYGESIPQGRDRDISVARQADYLVDWFRSRGLDRAILVGHDLGGGVVQIAAMRHPRIVAGIVLTNCIGYDNWPVPPVRMLRAAGALIERLPNRAVEPVLRRLLRAGHDSAETADESFALHWEPYAHYDGTAALIRQARNLDVDDTRAISPALPRLAGLPARVVWGDADSFLRIAYGERLARDLDAPLERVAGGKHFIPEDHPEAVSRAIEDVVREVERGRQAPEPPPLSPM